MVNYYTIKERIRRKSETLQHITQYPGSSLATVPSFLAHQPTMGGVNPDTVMSYITELLEEGSIYVKGGNIYPTDYKEESP